MSTENPIPFTRWCAQNNISRAFAYKLVNTGRGPDLTKIGRKTYIFPEADVRWREKMARGEGANAPR